MPLITGNLYLGEMTSPLWFLAPAFLLGLLFGSFLNVCISRLPARESLWHPRSHCRSCGRTIAWYDNIPALSWVLLRGKCRACGDKISWRYPIVELAMGLWFMKFIGGTLSGIMSYHQNWDFVKPGFLWDLENFLPYFTVAILGFLLIGLMVMDWQTQKLPNAFTIWGIVIGFVLMIVRAATLPPHAEEVILHGKNPITSAGSSTDPGNMVLTGPEHVFLMWLLQVVAAGCLLLVVGWLYKKIRGREGLGFGDAKLLAMIAAFLGFWPATLALFIGVVTCSAYALVLIVRGKAQAATRLPLGSFLCAGGLLAALVGERVIAWYGSLLRM
jgi:leader peptidase (prepilin peptidase)/N-methyltransferase